MALRRRSDVGPMSGRCGCDGAATSLRRRPTSGRCRCDGAATSGRCRGRCRCGDAATSLRRRADVGPMSGRCRRAFPTCRSDVGPMSLRWRCDVAPTSGRCRSDVAAMALRRRCDVAPISPLQNNYVHAHSHKDVTPCTEGGRKHEGLSFMMMEELGISSRRVTHGENVSVKYHQLVGHYRCLATVKLRHVDRQSVLYSPLQYSCTLSSISTSCYYTYLRTTMPNSQKLAYTPITSEIFNKVFCN